MGVFKREFVILEEQPNYYNKVQGLTPKGYANIEVRDNRGKITLNVYNLKANRQEEKLYKACLVNVNNKELTEVDLGVIPLNDSGKGKLEWKFDPESVGGTSLSIEKFNNILIKEIGAESSHKKMAVPLAGYIYKKDNSLNKIMKMQEKAVENQKVISKEYKEEVKIERSKEDTYNEIVDEPKEKMKIEREPIKLEKKEEQEKTIDSVEIRESEAVKDIAQNEEKEEKKEIQEIVENKTDTGDISIEDIPPLDLDINKDEQYSVKGEYPNYFKERKNSQVNYDYMYNGYGKKIEKIDPFFETAKNYSLQVANYTMDILKFFEEVKPFKERLKGCRWWKIEYNTQDTHRGFLPFFNYLVNVYYPYPLTSKTITCRYLMEKYKHYLFGIVAKEDEIKYYVYGVPGKFTISEHPYNGTTGFSTWLKDKNSSDGLGYWLMYIDALSGKIVNPVNPTIPTK